MKRTIPRLEGPARAVARGELIGRAVRIKASTDTGQVGQGGQVVDETLRTIVVRRPDGRLVRYGKQGTLFEFDGVAVAGGAIEFRPEDRTKKVK